MPFLLDVWIDRCFIYNIDNNHTAHCLLNIREADIKFTERNLCVMVFIQSLELFIQIIQDNRY